MGTPNLFQFGGNCWGNWGIEQLSSVPQIPTAWREEETWVSLGTGEGPGEEGLGEAGQEEEAGNAGRW